MKAAYSFETYLDYLYTKLQCSSPPLPPPRPVVGLDVSAFILYNQTSPGKVFSFSLCYEFGASVMAGAA